MPSDCIAGDVRATLNYALPNAYGTRLYFKQPRPDPSSSRSNYITNPRNVIVQDIRGLEENFSLDVNGFKFLTHGTTETFLDNESIETNYYAEVRQLVKEHTGAQRIFVLGHRTRQGFETIAPPGSDDTRERPPAHYVHIDKTPEAVARDVRKHLGDDAEDLLKGRVRFINVWRPIGQVVHHEPLAVADWQTSSDMSNLLPISVHTFRAAAFDAFISRFSAKHGWYYLSHQTPSEVTLIKCYDSCTDGSATFCLHSAFHDPGCHKTAPRRRSIEVNTLVFG